MIPSPACVYRPLSCNDLLNLSSVFICSWIPKARLIDTFDSDIIIDLEAHQSCLQICRNEGDVIVHRLAGGDLSDSDAVYVITDVPQVFEVVP